jgi:hypothetical protein
MYAKIQNGLIVKYPFTYADLQAQYPNSSVPSTWIPEFMVSEGIVTVVVTGGPAFDPNTQALKEEAPAYVAANSRWEQVWSVRQLTTEEVAQKQQQVQDQIVVETQARLDTFAQTRNYDGILSAATYATSPTLKFQAEGQYAVQARDATWAALYSIMSEVQAGTRSMPSGYADIEADLPALVWP